MRVLVTAGFPKAPAPGLKEVASYTLTNTTEGHYVWISNYSSGASTMNFVGGGSARTDRA